MRLARERGCLTREERQTEKQGGSMKKITEQSKTDFLGDLDTRAVNLLKRLFPEAVDGDGIAKQLASTPRPAPFLLKQKGVGRKNLEQIAEALERHGHIPSSAEWLSGELAAIARQQASQAKDDTIAALAKSLNGMLESYEIVMGESRLPDLAQNAVRGAFLNEPADAYKLLHSLGLDKR
ncbi:hypothetical protein [Humidesulfovibrio mexicanus]|nr:hypothetical protein [Humidesulfovibrio mexicanus]